MTFHSRVYHLGQFSEKAKAVAMAKCSRSKNTFMEDALAVTEEGAERFHETWVVNYGHESVADMSVGSACVEDLSILVTEDVMDLQTGKYQGKSSRYVVYSRDRVHNPYEDPTESLLYQTGIATLFDAYEALYAPVEAFVKEEWPDEKPATVRARVLDALRGLLPLGARTNFATRLTGRDTSAIVRKLLGHELDEARDLGEKLKAAGEDELSRELIRHTQLNPLDAMLRQAQIVLREEYQRSITVRSRADHGKTFVRLMHHDPHGVEAVAEAAVFEATGVTPTLVPGYGRWDEVMALLRNLLDHRQRRQDPVPHALRASRYRFEIAADFGVWKDLRRHRRNELFRPRFSAQWGHVIPDDIQAIGGAVLDTYHQAMQEASEIWKQLAEKNPAKAQYLVAHGHIQRFIMDMDAEQLYYIGELRTSPQGHLAYRRIAAEMVRLAHGVHPELFDPIRVHPVDGIQAHH